MHLILIIKHFKFMKFLFKKMIIILLIKNILSDKYKININNVINNNLNKNLNILEITK